LNIFIGDRCFGIRHSFKADELEKTEKWFMNINDKPYSKI
jgi:hypothetical protein